MYLEYSVTKELFSLEVDVSKKIGRNDLCPCGSGRKYKHCCGKVMSDMGDKPILQSIHVENFRSFQKLDISSLARVNLIAGKNSVGKTALLEAIFLFVGAENLELVLKISNFRGIKELKGDLFSVIDLLWTPLFYNLENNRRIKISGRLPTNKTQSVELAMGSDKSQSIQIRGSRDPSTIGRSDIPANQVLKLTYSNGLNKREFVMKSSQGELRVEPTPAEPPFPGYFLNSRFSPTQEETAEAFGKLIRAKKVDQLNLIEILKIVEPRLKQLNVVPSAGSSMIYGDIGLDQLLPISLMGDGMSRIMNMLLRIANASGGIVLIDEIENGLHYSMLENVWRVIDKAARTFNTQVIATTHSYECIREAHNAFSQNDDYGFLLHRLDRIKDRVESVTYDRETLEAAIAANFEVR